MATAAIRMSLFACGRPLASIPRACVVRSAHVNNAVTAHTRRSLTTSTPLKTAQQTPKSASTQEPVRETMDWNTYFALRKTRRNYERAFMPPCMLLGLGGAGYYFAQKDFDPTPIFGMDQIFVYAFGTVLAGIAGLAIGPVVGNMVFRLANSKARPLVDKMDKEFYKHIVRNRADPSSNSARNPIPDYYGEKIKSVSEYRTWLRKHREYRRKAKFYVGVD
ncbi:TIM23 complex component [Podila epigama]|nr:TIM23 complex component [Podila epigama]